jgi:hypothetical protein
MQAIMLTRVTSTINRIVYLRSELNGDPALGSSMPSGRPGGTLAAFELTFLNNSVTQCAHHPRWLMKV